MAVACFALNASAQMWCAPGAQWNYRIEASGIGGLIVRTYDTDTLFDGLLAQRIHETGYSVNYWMPPDLDTSAINRYVYTSMVDSTLLIWDNFNGTEEWDTLFRFDAQIGDRWFPPGADGVCDDGMTGMVMVVDTGHTIIDGVHLKTWSLDYCMANGDPWGYDLDYTERLGYHSGLQLLPSGCIIIEYGESLNCYTDSLLAFNAQAWPFGCASWTALTENASAEMNPPAPNPGTDHFTLQLPPGVHTVEVVDAMGRTVLREQAANSTTRMATGSLPAGAYSVRLVERDGSLRTMRWVKE